MTLSAKPHYPSLIGVSATSQSNQIYTWLTERHPASVKLIRTCVLSVRPEVGITDDGSCPSVEQPPYCNIQNMTISNQATKSERLNFAASIHSDIFVGPATEAISFLGFVIVETALGKT